MIAPDIKVTLTWTKQTKAGALQPFSERVTFVLTLVAHLCFESSHPDFRVGLHNKDWSSTF